MSPRKEVEPSVVVVGVRPLRPVLRSPNLASGFDEAIEVAPGVLVTLRELRSLGFDVTRHDHEVPLKDVPGDRALRQRATRAELELSTRTEELATAERTIQRHREADAHARLAGLERNAQDQRTQRRHERVVEILKAAVEQARLIDPEEPDPHGLDLESYWAPDRLAELLAAADDPCMTTLTQWVEDTYDEVDGGYQRVRRCLSRNGHDDNHLDQDGESFTDDDVLRSEQ
jgi:hypothetical protein